MSGYRLACDACGHEDAVPDDTAVSIYTCDQCGARTAYGTPMPRITVNPHEDRRFITVRFAAHRGEKLVEATFAFDRKYGCEFAFELLSVCDPAHYNALLAMVNRLHAAPGAAGGEGGPAQADVAALDDALAVPARSTPPAPAPAVDDVPLCQCGQPSVHRNGACAACLVQAVGGA